MSLRVATAFTAEISPAFADVATAIERSLGGPPTLALVFASTKQPLTSALPTLAARWPGAVTIGSSTAGELTESGDRKGSLAIFAVAGDVKVSAGMGRGVRQATEAAVAAATNGLPERVLGYPERSLLLLVDALGGKGEEVALLAAGAFGGDIRLAGGAAGDDLAMKTTHVGLGQEVADDAVVVAVLHTKEPLGLGVAHGHRAGAKTHTVTRATGNVVHEVDGRPAWDVWLADTRDAARAHGIDVDKLTPDAITPYLLRFEAALATTAAETAYKIRAPLSRTDDGGLAFACGIPEGTVFRIAASSEDEQIESARRAAKQAREQLGGRRAAGAVVFDCVCRKIILQDEFRLAVAGIAEELGSVPIAGFETYGEIALDAGDLSGFHNTTTVVLAFPA